MDRRTFILRGIEKDQIGLEIAPWFAPLLPKRDGFNVRILDIFDTETLRSRGDADPNVANCDQLETVDFVGSAVDIAAIVEGPLDYIVSSHNFEHLPDPIRFLQGAQHTLKPGGLLSMAVPDFRYSFDCFRPVTTIGSWLESYAERRKRPTSRQVFEEKAYEAKATGHPIPSYRTATMARPLQDAYDQWDGSDYRDAHCTIMCPASAELLIRECQALGLVGLSIEAISETNGAEFYIRLRNTPPKPFDIEEERIRLMRKVQHQIRVRPKLRLRYRLRKLLGGS